jgi:HAD superfamily hydrolase (TIGR01450 family)
MLIDCYEAFFIDLDGVVHVGDKAVPGAAETIDRLRRAGKTIRFLTNNSRSTRPELVDRLSGWGINADIEELITAAWITAQYLHEVGMGGVYVVGSEGLKTELCHAGMTIVDDPGTDPVDAVVVGLDVDLTYERLTKAVRALDGDTRLVAANVDTVLPTEDGITPGTGAIVSSIRAVVNIDPTVIGKPRTEMFDRAKEGVDPDAEILMLGDTPRSDVEGAHRAGIDAALVADPPPSSLEERRTPEAVIPDLGALFDPARTIGARESTDIQCADDQGDPNTKRTAVDERYDVVPDDSRGEERPSE